MGSFIRFLVTPPPGIRPEHFRAFVLFSVGSFCGVLVHVVYLGLFWAFGVEEMVLVNLLSIPAYAMAHRWNRRGWLMATSVVAAFELCIHQVLAVHYIGWDAGLQYYIILIPSVVFSMPGGRSLLKLSLVGLAIATFLALLAVSQRLAPVHELPVMALGVLNYVNIATVFVLLGFFAFNYARAAEVAEARLRTEYQRAESLLHNILPVPIAERLKETDGVIADGFSDASVLFADLVGFTELSQRVAPEELVALLNEIFSAFDDRVEAHGLEKIKTIGDAYMVAAGIPEPRADHAEALAELAFDLLQVIDEKRRVLGIPLEMRVGINSGPVVAGVIGKRKFIYDLWGDAVNTAARMESHGLPGQVQVTEETRRRLGESYRYEPRGEVPIKGKGTMPVFLVVGRS